MKKLTYFKTAVVGALIGLMAVWCTATTVSISTTANKTNLLVAGPGNLTSVSLTATTATAVTFWLFDAPATNTLAWTTAAWTNYTPTVYTNGVGPMTNSYVDPLGNTNVIAYLYLTNLPTIMTNLNTTTYSNNYRLISVFSVPASTTVTVPYTTANPFSFGLVATNNAGGSLSVSYQPYR